MKSVNLLFAVAGLMASASASAATIAKTFKFEGSGYQSTGGGAVPIPNVSLTFKVNFDNGSGFSRNGSAITVLSSSLTAFPAFEIAYDDAADRLMVGSDAYSNGNALFPGSNAFGLRISDISTAPSLLGSSFYTSTTEAESLFYSTTGSLTELASGAVPEPAAWAMMLAGFGSVGAAMRRRKATLAVA